MSATAKPVMLLNGMTQNPGGKEKFILSVIESLHDDYDIALLTDRDHVAFEKEREQYGVRTIRVCARNTNALRHYADIFQALRLLRPAVVWSHQTVINTLALVALAKVCSVPVRILHSHSSRNMSGRLAGKLHSLLKPFVSLCANRLFACSDEAAQWMFGTKRWTFVPNVFCPHDFTFDPHVRARLRSDMGLSADEQVIIHVARIGPAKNHEFDVEIMKALREKNSEAVLLLCGDGPYKEHLEEEVKKEGLESHIRFLGLRHDVPDLLSAADVMILPSFFEGLPYTVLEAQAAGLPVLMSDRVSNRSALEGANCSFLSIDQGVQPWLEALYALQGNPRGENVVVGSLFDQSGARQVMNDAIGRVE